MSVFLTIKASIPLKKDGMNIFTTKFTSGDEAHVVSPHLAYYMDIKN